MDGNTGNLLLFAIVVSIAVMTLVRMMRVRRDQITQELEQQVAMTRRQQSSERRTAELPTPPLGTPQNDEKVA